MALQCGIVGLPNVGKSTLFNCLSSAKAQAGNFPFCTIEPNVGVITVPDPRLTRLTELVQPKKVQPATVEIVDIAGLVKGASKGEGLGNKFLSNIMNTNAIIHVLRCFDDDNITHVDGSVDPVRDKEIIDIELQIKDLEIVESRIQKQQKLIKTGSKTAKQQLVLLNQFKEHLESGQSARSLDVDPELIPADFQLLTMKPVLYICNVDEDSVHKGNDYVTAVKEAVKDENADVLLVAVQVEADIAELDDPDERAEFLEDAGMSEAGSARLIRSAYHILGLLTYFTAGVQEVRAWTFKGGMKAPQTAGVIHTDFEKGFIRAEVIKYQTFSDLGSEQACKDAGKMSVEGKDYVVEDGDIMHFRFNV